MQIVTIKSLARELNLSVSTVSKALRDSYEISKETKQRVAEMAERLQYTPNPYASSLRRRKSKTIALVIPEVADSFFSLAINGIETVAQEKGYHVLIYLTHENFSKEQAILKDFQSGRVDGVIMSVSRETSGTRHIHELLTRDVPVVFFDRVCDDIDTAKITTNDQESGYKAAMHLIRKGCRHLAYLSLSKNLLICNLRLEGFKKALEEQGMPVGESDILYCSGDPRQNYHDIKKMLKGKNRPDGIVASVEKLATKIYLAAAELGIDIPRELKVISFSNLEIASILRPSLTSITQPAFEMGKAAAKVLFNGIEKKNFKLETGSEIIPSILIERDSTK